MIESVKIKHRHIFWCHNKSYESILSNVIGEHHVDRRVINEHKGWFGCRPNLFLGADYLPVVFFKRNFIFYTI